MAAGAVAAAATSAARAASARASRRRGRRCAGVVSCRAESETATDGEVPWLNTDFVPSFTSPGENLIWEYTFTPVLVVVALTAAILEFNLYFSEGPVTSFAVLGTLVSLITVFRTSQAYQRYWEARSKLGLLMAGLVDAASSAGVLLDSGPTTDNEWRSERKMELARLFRLYMREAVDFLRAASIETKSRSLYWKNADEVKKTAMRDLGAGAPLSDGVRVDATEEEVGILVGIVPRARAALVLQRLRSQLQQAAIEERAGGTLIAGNDAGIRLCVVAQQVGPSLAKLQAEFNACAKIATTPFPDAYVRIGRILRFSLVYSAPFFLAGKLGGTTFPICALIAFGYHGIDAIANQLVNPFVGRLGDAVLDGRFVKAVCDDVDALLISESHLKS